MNRRSLTKLILMDLVCAAGQYEHSYLPHKLGNWEVSAQEQARCRSSREPFVEMQDAITARTSSITALAAAVVAPACRMCLGALPVSSLLCPLVVQKSTAEAQYGTLRARSGRTQPIVDERGHLLPGESAHAAARKRSHAHSWPGAAHPSRCSQYQITLMHQHCASNASGPRLRRLPGRQH